MKRPPLITRRKLITGAAALAAYNSLPAHAQFKGGGGFGTPGFTSPAVTASGPPVASFIASNGNPTTSGAATYTWTANIGNPAYIATRRVICVLTSPSIANGAPIASATINGVAATVHVAEFGSNTFAAIFSAVVTSGTTSVSVVVNFTTVAFGGVVPLVTYMVDNSLLLSPTPTTSVGTASTVASISTSAFLATSGGFVIGGAALDTGNTGLAASGYTTDAFGGTFQIINFSDLSGSKSGSITPTAAWGTSTANASIAAAAWR